MSIKDSKEVMENNTQYKDNAATAAINALKAENCQLKELVLALQHELCIFKGKYSS